MVVDLFTLSGFFLIAVMVVAVLATHDYHRHPLPGRAAGQPAVVPRLRDR